MVDNLLKILMITCIIVGVLGILSGLFVSFSTAGLIGGIVCVIIGSFGLIVVINK